MTAAFPHVMHCTASMIQYRSALNQIKAKWNEGWIKNKLAETVLKRLRSFYRRLKSLIRDFEQNKRFNISHFQIHRKESIFNLGSAETKLLYTLHWVLLDAMDECSLEEKEKGNTDYNDYNLPLSSITVI